MTTCKRPLSLGWPLNTAYTCIIYRTKEADLYVSSGPLNKHECIFTISNYQLIMLYQNQEVGWKPAHAAFLKYCRCVLTLCHTVLTFNNLLKKALKKLWEKEEKGNQHFLLFPQCSLLY